MSEDQKQPSDMSDPIEQGAEPTAEEILEEAFAADDVTVNADVEPAIEIGTPSAAALEQEVADLKNQLLRAHAELDNYRKRANRQIEEERRYASMSLIRDLLPVWDNMGRAAESAEQSHDTSTLLEGLRMMSDQLLSALERHHCKPIEADNQTFNPHVHEAIAQVPSPDHEPNSIVTVTQAGFTLHDRVVRPSQVVVAAAPPAAPAEEASEES